MSSVHMMTSNASRHLSLPSDNAVDPGIFPMLHILCFALKSNSETFHFVHDI